MSTFNLTVTRLFIYFNPALHSGCRKVFIVTEKYPHMNQIVLLVTGYRELQEGLLISDQLTAVICSVGILSLSPVPPPPPPGPAPPSV